MSNQIVKRAPVIVNPLYEDNNRVKLSGKWRFRLDPEDVGVEEKWFDEQVVFGDFIDVPGCWQGQGFGDNKKEMHKEFGVEVKAFPEIRRSINNYIRVVSNLYTVVFRVKEAI